MLVTLIRLATQALSIYMFFTNTIVKIQGLQHECTHTQTHNTKILQQITLTHIPASQEKKSSSVFKQREQTEVSCSSGPWDHITCKLTNLMLHGRLLDN